LANAITTTLTVLPKPTNHHMIQDNDYPKPWPLWQKVLFRFFFIYFMLYILSWPAFGNKRLVKTFGRVQNYIIDTIINAFNTKAMHFRDGLTNLNNSNDTSFRFVQITLYLILAVTGTIIWSATDRKRQSYYRADYYLKNFIRYFIALISFVYGSIKVFALQMKVPSLTDMALPLGDLTSNRLAWLYVGYSPAYQIFLGLAEVMAGVLLLYRRTVTLGLLVAFGVYVNVMMINLNYNIVVKMFSINLVIMIVYLLITDAQRLTNFFILNKPVGSNMHHHVTVPSKKSGRIFRVVLKTFFILHAVYLFAGYNKFRMEENVRREHLVRPVYEGLYEVSTFVKNGDTLPVLANDDMIWKDIIFEKNETSASVNTADTLFAKYFSRGIFYYDADTVNKSLACYKTIKEKRVNLFTLKYNMPDKQHVELRTKIQSDSLYLMLTRSKKQFRLARQKFKWLVD